MTDPTPAERSTSSGPPALALGVILVVVGLVLFLGQLLDIGIGDIGIGDIGWPFFVIAIGLVLLVLGLSVVRETGLIVGGTVVTVVGLVLFYQHRTDHWESWAYAWALVGPAASGLGLALSGIRFRDGGDVRRGTWGMLGGLALFAIGFLFFEGVIGISGERLPFADWVLPVAVIVIGAVLLARGLMQRRDHAAP
ncbi:MAG TPA: hypothetical protein VMP86_07460 [Candidatus Binatia bacterium]|nr:hypothetical protein [Candidatus Binatia bacterium]